MSTMLGRFGIPAWPIWLKLLAGLALATMLPVALLFVLAVTSIQEISSQNVRLFVSQLAADEAREISHVFDAARSEVDAYIDDEDHYAALQSVLPLDDASELNPDDRALVVEQLQDSLLNTSVVAFEFVDLIDTEGRLVVQALPGRQASIPAGNDLSDTRAFQAAIEAQLLGESQVLSIDFDADNQPVVDWIVILSILDAADTSVRQTIGYLLIRLDFAPVILENLETDSDFLNLSSQLVTRRGLVIDQDGVREQTGQEFNAELLRQVEAGETRIETVIRDGEEIIRYYAPIASSPFIIVSEGSTSLVSDQIVDFFVQRGFPVVLGIVLLLVVLVLLGNQLFTPPLRRVTQAIQAMARGDYTTLVPDLHRGDEIGQLAGSFADMRKQVISLINDLEERIEARMRDVSATREISNAAATQRDLESMMDQVVNLLVERFDNIYHAQIFLVDKDRRFAVLRASTGEIGQRMLLHGHRLAIGRLSVVGSATETGQMILAGDTVTSSVHRSNPNLPETLSELAIPLHIGQQVIGVLDVQSKSSRTFSQEQMEVLQTMADQVAVAIENARLYSESLRRLSEIEHNRQLSAIQAWHNHTRNMRLQRLESSVGVQPAKDTHDALRQRALKQGEVVVGELTDRQTIPIAAPIRLRHQLLGIVEWEVPQDDFDMNKVQLAQNLTDQLAVNLENARLFQESQRATQRERLVNEISANLTTQNDIDQILQTAVREVGMALRSPQVSIRLNSQAPPNVNGIESHGNTDSESRGES